ncbi:hypothetical protein BC938DRAFT_470948 [Jimgerdemannia flammicorona]|uniref:UBA domain-containing protein n=1 Tax=Jimgerdemannia flammicorona TaxID=994334 RepID=A0A433Q944_9FUNG|nr:hypothetical protein BC938DRAFT_470948 [Jimgerdemannia flammicorona]
MFNDVKPIDHFFSIFTSADHLRCLSDGDTASILGTSIDELMRHHPTLKNDVIEAILAMLRRLLGMGQLENARPDDENYALLIGRPDDMVDTEMATAPIDLVADSEKAAAVDQNKPEEKKESVLVQTIDVTARFLEGLFQNNSHCREFFKQNGLELLLKLYSLPLAPYDFANSPASYSLSHLFHLVTEVNSVATVHEILKRVQTVLTDAKPFLEYEGPTAMIADFIDLNGRYKLSNAAPELDSEKVKNANEVFRTLITLHGFVGLLSDVCCAPVFSHSKSGMAVIQEFIGLAGETIIPLLGQLHRACVWENILLKNAVPKSWYAAISKAKKPGSELGASGAGPITALETLIEDMDKETDSNAEEPVNQNDRKVKNTKFLKHLVTQMPNCLVPIFQGLTKMLMARRVMDATQKKQAYKVADFVSCLLRDHLTWSRIRECLKYRKDIVINVSRRTYILFVDTLYAPNPQRPTTLSANRSQMSLQTVLVLAFDRNQGTEHLFDTLRLLWKNAEAIQSISEAEAERDQATKEKLARIHSGLEITLNIFQFLGSAKLLHDSPHTSSIVSKEKDRGTPEFFDAHEWLIGMRAKLLPVVKELFDSPYLKRCPPNLVRSIVRNLVQLLKGDGEVNQRAEGLGPVGPAPSIFAPRPMIPDQGGVQTLTEMGFPRAAAESALLRCANQVARAIDYLFTHPENVDAAPRHAPPTDNTEDVTTDAATAAAAAPVPPAEATGSGSESVPAPSQPEAGAAEFLPGPELADDDDDDEEDESALEQALALSMNAESAPTETVIEGPEAMSTTPETAPMVATPEAEPDINSTDDAEAVENASTEKADKGKQKDKGKEKEVSRIEELRALRELIKVTLAPHVLEILDQTDDVIFDIRDLFAILCKDNADQTLDFLLSNVDQYRAASNTDEEAKKALGVRMRLLALLFRESSAQAKIPTFSPKLFPTLLDMVGIEASQSVDTPTSSWLASVLLVVEAFISQADEPKTVELEHKSDDEKKEGANEDKAMEIDEKEDKDNKMVIDKESFTEDQRSRLLRYCVELSKRSKPTKDNLHAVLRILVRLTRHYSAAVEFVEMEGLQLLFAQPRSGIDGFQGQQAFVILILRHIIEDTRVLQNTMEKEINSWFTHPHPRLVDVNTFVRNNAHVVLREPPVFVEATKIICKLTKHDRSGSTNQITLARNEADAAPTVSASERVDDAKDTNLATDEKDLTAVPLEIPKKHPYTSEVSETVVHFLINELLASRASTVAAPIPVAQTPVASTLAKGKDSATPEEESSVSDQVKADDKNNDNGAYTYTGFLLQCLVELLSSYPSCKVDVINFAQLNRRRTSKDPSTPSKPRAIFLNFLLNELLPYGSVNPHEEQTRKRFALSTWAASVLVALCSNGGNSDDSKQQPELGQVRRFVLDGILRSFKDAIVSTDIIGVKYGKLLALADLCHRILNARPSSGGPGGKPSDDMSTNVAKIMLEKSFVSTLTNAVSEIDLNFPNSKMVINALLRPLEQLTKIAIKMGRAAEPVKDGKRRTNEDNRNVFPSTEDNTEDEEAPNLYRHSALGMYESGIPSEEDEEDLGTTEDEEGYDEGGDYEDETGSDMSDITDEESLSVDDMEEDLEIGIHHRHYSDMDDEDEEDEEAGTGEDDPHTEEEYDPPAEEVERGMTWDVDDVDDADEPHAHPVMLVPDEIEEEVESGEEPDRLRHRNRFAQVRVILAGCGVHGVLRCVRS